MILRPVLSTDLKLVQSFIRTKTNGRLPTPLVMQNIIAEQKASTVALLPDSNYLIKLVRGRTWHEHIKIFWKRSRVHTEFKGARMLQRIGINTPALYEMGVANPFSIVRPYIGYYVMENLSKRNLQPVYDLASHGDINSLEKILKNILNDLIKMKNARLVYSDLHLSNVFYCPNTYQVYFIDTAAKKYILDKSIKRRSRKSIEKFITGFEAKFQIKCDTIREYKKYSETLK